jgi:PIN domain nuclease of toxin-antitoxin system
MRLLLDSHVIVWWALFPGRLRAGTREAIIAPDNEIFVSAASICELGLKIARQKLRLPADYASHLLAHGFDELPVSIAHAGRAITLPPLHGDPFDRLLVAQALEEGLVLVTGDQAVIRYDVPTLEA